MPKRHKISVWEVERERFSNFVVDLRPKRGTETAAREIAPAAKSESRKTAKIFKKTPALTRLPRSDRWEKFFRWFKRPNPAGWRAVADKPSPVKPVRPTAPRPRRKKESPGWFRSRRPRPAVSWRDFVRAQENIFAAALNPSRLKILQQTLKSTLKPEKPAWPRPAAKNRLTPQHLSLLTFILVLLVIVFFLAVLSFLHIGSWSTLAARVTGRSESGLHDLMTAANSAAQKDFTRADANFQQAGANFLAAADDLRQINSGLLSLATLSNNPKIKLAAEGPNFLAAGAAAADLGHHLVLATDSLFNGDKNNFPANLDNFLNYGHQAVRDAAALAQAVNRVNPDNLPASYRAQFLSLRQQAGLLAANLNNFVTLGDEFKEVLGLARDKRYLLVFQNNAEMRASGGFLGSYALVDISEGKITNLEVPAGGSYDTEGGMTVRVVAPQPLWLVNPLWHFWDANWWPDWPKTAQNLMWFYEKSGGPSVDGVISLTPTVVERLLQITGPIDLQADYGLTITSDNFWETIQKITEQPNLVKTDPAAVAGLPAQSPTKPKKIIGDLMAKILAILPQKLSQDNLAQIISQFQTDMSEKQILLYFTDPQLEAAAASRNWAGQVSPAAKDYLMVVNTNIAGQKSDRLMTQAINQTISVGSDGRVIDTVQITRTHTGAKNAPLTGVRNVDWLRVYVPLGSELLSASGFTAPDPQYFKDQPDSGWENSPLLAAENAAAIDPTSGTKIYADSGHTVFANWLMVDPGESATVTLQYALPFNFLASPVSPNDWLSRLNNWLNPNAPLVTDYSLLAQKQPGEGASAFTSALIVPSAWHNIWHYPSDLSDLSGWNIKTSLDSDRYWSVLLEKNKK